MQLDNKWGILNKYGVAVQFCFEYIVLVDNKTAFVKLNGKYGILDANKIINEYRKMHTIKTMLFK